ncbi:MAG: phosphatase PAP2 family protein [Nannocystaceae bacterium]|nr:phosphatase PAP2 family protein [bacterium]
MKSFASVAALADLLRTFRQQLRVLPAPVPRQWWTRLAVGWVATAAFVIASSIYVQRHVADGQVAWDFSVLRAVVDSGVSLTGALWLGTCTNTVFIVPLVFALTAWWIARGRPLEASATLLAIPGTATTVVLGWWLAGRDRPTFLLGSELDSSFPSYPSGHVAQAACFYGLLCWFWFRSSRSTIERAMIVFVWLAVVAATAFVRLRIETHWPTDVLGGLVVGTMWLATLVWGLKLGRSRR